MPAVLTDLNQLDGDLQKIGPLLGPLKKLLTLLYNIGGGGAGTVGGDIHAVFTAAATGLTDGSQILSSVATNLSSLGGTVTDTAKAIAALQSALATAQTLTPGIPALSSASQFFSQISDLLTTLGDYTKAAAVLSDLSTQFNTIATAIK